MLRISKHAQPYRIIFRLVHNIIIIIILFDVIYDSNIFANNPLTDVDSLK